ncbi:hypothetical protein PoB_002028200 [Plakobranchus ocellatus]|uniref:Uncharacterized protein n=1 Tax=Plakobranchus ocellatus TaxID=259542 RepID=A0AAV3ZH06_9GAST|nr:hypothetical protein PoB_002028200 [Plakobranchus ocellatus]
MGRRQKEKEKKEGQGEEGEGRSRIEGKNGRRQIIGVTLKIEEKTESRDLVLQHSTSTSRWSQARAIARPVAELNSNPPPRAPYRSHGVFSWHCAINVLRWKEKCDVTNNWDKQQQYSNNNSKNNSNSSKNESNITNSKNNNINSSNNRSNKILAAITAAAEQTITIAPIAAIAATAPTITATTS